VLWRKDYAPFGEQLDSTSAGNDRFAYTGKEHDDITGLTYFGARYYDPEIGRFMSVDPAGFVDHNPMSFNRYLYVNNNPYKYVDPDGEFLNFAAKFVLDVGLNIAINYITTGELGVGAALRDSAIGMLNPAKTVVKAGKLVALLAKSRKVEAFAQKISTRVSRMPCPLSCFVAGTTVLAEHGFVPIEQLQVGDKVWAHDPETGVTALKPIVRTFVNTKDSVWQLTIEKDGQRYLHEVTGTHPYYVIDGKTGRWVQVSELQPGMLVETEGGGSARILGLRDTGEVLTTYNLEVADIHTYYVSAAKVLVHNCNRHKAKYQLRNADGTFKTSGAVESGGAKGAGRMSWKEQQKLHTEGKILKETEGQTKPGDILTIQGQKPACNMCKGAMNKAGNERDISISYSDASGKKWDAN